MNVLDWCLLVARRGVYALSGYWQGFITGAFATAGLLLGGLVGIWVAPLALGDADPVAVGLPGRALHRDHLRLAGAGALPVRRRAAPRPDHLAADPGRRRHRRRGPQRRRRAARRVGARRRGLRHPHRRGHARWSASSTVLAKVDRALPADADKVLQTFNNVVGTTFFPRYLEPFAPERIVDGRPGDPRMLTDPDVIAAEASVLKVRGTNGCGRGVEGTGFFYAPGRLMTNAHVVAGVDQPEVEVGGTSVTARSCYYDPDLDIAVLSLPDTGSLPLAFDTEVQPRDPVAVLGYPEDGPYDVESGRVRVRAAAALTRHLRRGHRHPPGLLPARH